MTILQKLRVPTALCLMAIVAGCANRRPATTQPTTLPTDIDPATATQDYWFSQPAIASVTAVNYEHLFVACDHVLRQRYFPIDRSDFRDGILTSRPLISQQIWETWRDDVGDTHQKVNSSLATYRRTVQWSILPSGDGRFTAYPRVVVERYTSEPKRITAVTSYRSAITSGSAHTRLESPNLGSIQTSHWYAVGRDQPLEQELAKHARDWLVGD